MAQSFVRLMAASVAALTAVANAVASSQTPLAPVCTEITCADIECKAPLEMRRAEGQCCPICWAPDHIIGLDRHTALQGENPYARDAHPAAPPTCAGVKCFHPACAAGYHEGHVQGRCCASCIQR
eukprot:TRINITY_DN483_c0_g1_i2.p2 TRINITY_DN483_c0_g1~~TRINITY_DN483_c0_g1_i2.p2  ORF type:complete len:125 (+),score=11.21 TRINITY_DN483_c0_g1_i2:79-453(+)